MLAGLDPAAEEALGTTGAGQDPGWADYGLGQATVMDGVRLIAGGIEVVLQRLQLQVGLNILKQTPHHDHDERRCSSQYHPVDRIASVPWQF